MMWLHCPACPCGYGKLSWTLPVCSPGRELEHGPSLPTTSACCSTHTAQQWRGEGWRSAQEGPWELLFLSRTGCCTCALGAAQLHGRGIFWCIHYTSIKGFKKGAQKPYLFQGRGDLHRNGNSGEVFARRRKRGRATA